MSKPAGEGYPDDRVLWDDIDSPADDRWQATMLALYPELDLVTVTEQNLLLEIFRETLDRLDEGGPGSGNFGHSGRPGLVGGSASGSGGLGYAGVADQYQIERKKVIADHRDIFGVTTPGMSDQAIFSKAMRYGAVIDIQDKRLVETFEATQATDVVEYEAAHRNPVSPTGIVKMANVSRTMEFVDHPGVSPDYCFQQQSSWATTANDSEPEALVLQMAAAKVHGLELSDWQEHQVQKTANNPDAYKRKLWDKANTPTNRAMKESYVRATYQATQKVFKNFGFKDTDQVLLFRGIRGMPGLSKGVSAYLGNTMESWSFNLATAFYFARESLVHDGALIARWVSISDIVSSAISGLGCYDEGEVIVLSELADLEVLVLETGL